MVTELSEGCQGRSEPFRVQFSQDLRADLRHRLAAVRWSDAVTADWRYGMNPEVLRTLIGHWRTSYDFDAAEERLNAIPQFRVEIDGFGVHYLLLKGRGPRPRPLLLMNGWPSSFAEYQRLAPRLADPEAFGGAADESFDVIMPALPGFGFSDRPRQPHQVLAEDLFHRLMTEELGYTQYFASGTDIGAGVATRLAMKFPRAVTGIHLSAVADPPLTPASRPLSPAETYYLAQADQWAREEGAYEHVHYTRPQTLAFALSDSPVGLASWIVEKFALWSDHGAGEDVLQVFPLDLLIDNLMIYWATETIGSSMRYYFDDRHFRSPLAAEDHVNVPTAVCMWPADLVTAPREWAERFYDVRQYSRPARGGHFPAWEAPEVYAEDFRAFVRALATG
ncbi:alpha/beta fold hydrolase [Deinococcus sp. HMF7620]|uniref:Alpha/beta fold hydrolase n=1 Tax=Deinococcus arboris TaxID=2682977 RepID=A0A7C9LRT3_9DEIO|nr:epoxide hydrolase family protein [Deinococcus arboris]MVN85640.1 alpha/beta fold hydrolase [Deinococcus arboris]